MITTTDLDSSFSQQNGGNIEGIGVEHKIITLKEFIHLSGLALLTCLLVGLILIGSRAVRTELPFPIGSVISGIWTGIAFTFISRPIMDLDWSWSHWQRQSYLNRIYSIHMILGGVIFCIGGAFGSGVVFGIDLIGICERSNLQDMLAGLVQGNIFFIMLIGIIFGMYMAVSMWLDTYINKDTNLEKIMVFWGGIPFFIGFGFALSGLLATPFIFVAVIARVLSSIVLYKFLNIHNLLKLQKSLIMIGLFLLPLIAYVSRGLMVCPS